MTAPPRTRRDLVPYRARSTKALMQKHGALSALLDAAQLIGMPRHRAHGAVYALRGIETELTRRDAAPARWWYDEKDRT